MRHIYDPSAPRRPTNLSLNRDLVEKARAARLNLSSLAEEAIGKELARITVERFRAEIDRGVEEHAAYLREYGSLADAVRALEADADRG